MSSPNLNQSDNENQWESVHINLPLAVGWVTGLTCGMQFIIYLLCVYVLLTSSSASKCNQFQQPKVQQPSEFNSINPRGLIYRIRNLSASTFFLLIYSTILCIVNILYTGSSYVVFQFMNGGLPGSLEPRTQLLSKGMAITMLVLTNVLSDALLLWRCRLIWRLFTGRKAELVMLFPLMMLLGSFATGMLWRSTIVTPPDRYEEEETITNAGLAYFALSLSTNILLTSLIVLRIYVYQLHLRKAIGQGYGYDGQYTGIVAMFVESSVMSCMGSLFFFVTTALRSGVTAFGIGFTPAFQIISTYLIILRVGQGRAWSKTTIHQDPGNIGATSTTANRGVLSTIAFAPQERTLHTNIGVDATRMDISQLECGDMTGIRNGNGIDEVEIYVLEERGVKATSGLDQTLESRCQQL